MNHSPVAFNSYRVGTLVYTPIALRTLFLWVLMGDFAFMFFESIFGRFAPLYLEQLGASNTLIGLMTGSFAGLVNLLFLPNISRWSDRLRSPLGRRIPFLLVVTPLVVGAIVAVGFAPEIGTWLYRHFAGQRWPGMSQASLILGLLSIFVVAYHLFNMILVNSYNWLIRDVVPQEVMARFLAWFRIIGMVSSFLFLWFVFPHILEHRQAVCIGAGLFYLVAFLFMCWNVKEGEYPEPAPETHPGLLHSFAMYFRECLQTPLYRNYFIAYVLVVVGTACASPFITLFAKSTLSIDMDGMGRIFAWTAAVSTVAFFPVGWLCDRYFPMPVVIASATMLCISSIAAAILICGKTGFYVYSLLFALPTVGWQLGALAVTMKLFPAEKFGQFSSGINVFGCGALIFGNYLMGVIIDLFHSNHRLAFIWSAVFYALAVPILIAVHREWKRVRENEKVTAVPENSPTV